MLKLWKNSFSSLKGMEKREYKLFTTLQAGNRQKAASRQFVGPGEFAPGNWIHFRFESGLEHNSWIDN